MLHFRYLNQALAALALWLLLVSFPGCTRLRVPAIDPSGERIFLPLNNSTTILTPNASRPAKSGCFGVPLEPSFTRPSDPQSCCGKGKCCGGLLCGKGKCCGGKLCGGKLCGGKCCGGKLCHLGCCGHKHEPRRHVIPSPKLNPTRGETGEIMLTPSRIIAPVGAEVVVLAGICGSDHHFVMNQPLEWMLSNDSVGQIIEVGGMQHPNFNKMVPPTTRKFDGNYAWGRTGLKHLLLTRGTPVKEDDIELLKGQTYISLSSASEGTSYVTCVAPKAQAWDKRRMSTIVHWVDAVWSIPLPKTATAGTVTPLTTLVTRNTDSGGVEGWRVKYTIVGGAPAEFAPTGSREAEALTNADGQATVQIRQVAGQFETGTTQVRVDVIRPRLFGESELTVESSITTVTWSAPALTIRAIGPRTAGIKEAFNYRVEVSNPGDQLTRGVLLKTRDFPEGLEFVSSTPKPTVFGRELQWQLGDILPGSPPQIVDIQLKSNTRGQNELCFEVSSQTDQLQTEACAQTEISVPCLGLEIEGPDAARVGDQVRFNIAIVNQCDEPLEGIQLQIQYDAGLLATGLGNPIRANVPSLSPGEKKEIPVIFDVVRAGRHCFNLSVTANGGHTARATECVEATPATAAALTLELSGRSRVDRGSRALIRAVVANNGNVPMGNVTLTNRFSDSLEPRRVTEQYPHRWLGTTADELIFDLGRLDPGQSKSVEIIYDALAVDGDAFSEYTVSSPDLSPITRRYNLRIEPTGTLGDAGDAGLEPGGVDPAVLPPNQGNGPPLVIPDDSGSGALNTGSNLQATARAIDRQTSVNNPARMQFEIRNNSGASDTNINISLLVPPSMQLANVVDDLGNEIPIVSRSRDFTRLDLEPRREMRPGDSMTIVATLIATQPGSSFVEIQATSDNAAGSITAGDSISVIP